MSSAAMAKAANAAPGSTEANGRQAAAELIELMNALLAVVESETELVRAGRLAEAAELGARKSALSGRYLADMVRLKADAGAWLRNSPDMLDHLQRRHDLFHALLQINLAVLATAHAVAEGLIRGAVEEVARKAIPNGYGARGNAVAPAPKTAQPVVLSKSY